MGDERAVGLMGIKRGGYVEEGKKGQEGVRAIPVSCVRMEGVGGRDREGHGRVEGRVGACVLEVRSQSGC